jgi:Amidohydrolase family
MIAALLGLTCTRIEPDSRILFHSVNVVDVARGKIRKHQDVLIEGDRITQIGRITAPDGTQVIEGKGKYLIPGLWDMHVHGSSVASFLSIYTANGVTGVRDMFTSLYGVIPLRNAIRRGNMVGPEIVAAGRIIDGPKPIWPGSITASSEAEGRAGVQTAIKEGSDFIKVYSLLPREAFFGIADEAKKAGKVFCGHVPNSVTLQEAATAGQKSNEHMMGWLAACSSGAIDPSLSARERTERFIATFDSRRANQVIRQTWQAGMWQCPTLSVLHNIAYLDDPKLSEDPRLKYVPAYITQGWDPKADFRFKARTADDWRVAKLSYDLNRRIVRMIANAGVPLLAGTDTMNPYVFPGFSLHDELRLLVEAGVSPADALRAATLNPARYFGRESEIGQVKQGFVANLVLLNDNPLKDIRNTTKIESVIQRGRLFNRSQLDDLLLRATSTPAGSKPSAGYVDWDLFE